MMGSKMQRDIIIQMFLNYSEVAGWPPTVARPQKSPKPFIGSFRSRNVSITTSIRTE